MTDGRYQTLVLLIGSLKNQVDDLRRRLDQSEPGVLMPAPGRQKKARGRKCGNVIPFPIRSDD